MEEALTTVWYHGALEQAASEQLAAMMSFELVPGTTTVSVMPAPGSPQGVVDSACQCDTAGSHRGYVWAMLR